MIGGCIKATRVVSSRSWMNHPRVGEGGTRAARRTLGDNNVHSIRRTSLAPGASSGSTLFPVDSSSCEWTNELSMRDGGPGGTERTVGAVASLDDTRVVAPRDRSPASNNHAPLVQDAGTRKPACS